MKSILEFVAVATLGLVSLNAQSLDNTGDNLLNGAFRFRQLAVVNIDQNGNPTEVAGAYGVITFNGAGGYSLTGTYVDNTISNGTQQALTVTGGTYVIGSNGLGYIDNPLFTSDSGSRIYGAVAQGVFVGSATESSQVNDLLIAIPAGTPPTNASFNSPYQVGVLDFTGGTSVAIKNALFKLSPNGSGGFAAITLNGQASNQSANFVTQTVSGATYNFQSDGSATLTFPVPSGVSAGNALVAGTRTIFVSADGNFILGYNPLGYDMIVGVKALTSSIGAVPPNGLYFNGALEDYPAGNGVDNFYGSIHSFGDTNGDAIIHERLASPFFYPTDYGTDDQIGLNPDGTTTYQGCTDVLCTDSNGYSYSFGDGGKAFVAIGTFGFFSVGLGVVSPSAPGPSTSSVYLDPIGIVNAASGAPITASLAPGETISLYGSNLAQVTMNLPSGSQGAPNILGGTQVVINGIAAPLYYVSKTQVNAVVPWETSAASIASIQVINNGTPSNTVTLYLADSAPGVFTQDSSGIGFGAATHADYSLITPSNPAQPGETILVFLTGLGSVTPAVSDGALGAASSPLNMANLWTSNNMTVYFNDYTNGVFGAQGTGGTNNDGVQYAGLAPGLLGYQLNVTIPTSVGPSINPGVYLEILTDSADVNQVQIPVGGTAASAARPQARSSRASVHHARPAARRKGPQPARRLGVE